MKHSFYILSICAGAFLLAAPARADVINLNYVAVATGEDYGPQDGVFDSFPIFNLGSVNNNGYTSYRTAFEFALASLPPGATINSATLTMVLSNFEGTRAIQVHGYAGDGTVQLADFSLNGLAGAGSAGPGGTQTLTFDVTAAVAGLAANNAAFAGFNVREAPANSSNFTVMFLALTGVPVLSIEYSTGLTVDIDIHPGKMPNSINGNSKGKIPVAILSSSVFDAAGEVNEASLTFGRNGNEPSLAFCNGHLDDVNGDGLLDLVCRFDIQAAGFLPGDTQGVLKGETRSGVPLTGTDSVRIVH